jgi:hypothetical protein
MQPSSDAVHELLELWVTAGGSWTVGLSSTVPYLDTDGTYTGITDVTTLDDDRVTIARSGGSWDAPAGRAIVPAADLDFGDATADFTWAAWVLYDGSDAVLSGRMSDAPLVRDGTGVVLPRTSMPISMPAVGVS